MNRIILRRLLITIGSVAGLLVGLYLFSAQSLSWLATLYLQKNGFEDVVVKTGRPGLDGVQVRQLSFRTESTVVTATGIAVSYDQSVLQGRLQTIQIDSVSIRQGKLIVPDQPEPPAPVSLPDLSRLWSLVPAEVVTLDELIFLMEDPDLQIRGRASLDPEQASLQLTINSNLLPGALDAGAVLTTSGKLDVAVGLAGAPALLEVTGLPDLAANQVELTATVEVTNEVFRFVRAVLVNGSLLDNELAAVLNDTNFGGSVSVYLAGRIPWEAGVGLAADANSQGANAAVWQQLTLRVDAELDLSTVLPVVGVATIRGPVAVVIDGGQAVLSSAGINIGVRSITTNEITYRVTDVSTARLVFDFQSTLEDAVANAALAMAGTAQVDWHVVVGSDSDLALARLTESSGFLLVSKRRGQVIEAADVRSKLSFSAADIARSEGFKNATARGELELLVSEQTASLSADKIALALAGVDYKDVSYLVELAKPAGLQFKLAVPRKVVADAIASPEAPLPMALVTISAGVQLEASVSSDDPAALLAFGSVATTLGIKLNKGLLYLNLPEQAAFDLALPTMDVGLKADSPARIRWDLGRETLLMEKSLWTLRIPELTLLDQRVAFRNAQLSLESIHYKRPLLELKGLVKARSSRNAVPLAFDVRANTNLEVADFTIEVDHQVMQPLLKTEFSGWRAPYELGSGALKLGLVGKASLVDGTVGIDATGNVSISAGAASYEDIKLAGLAANFPVSVSGGNASLLPGRLSIDAIDAGVPVQNVQMSLHTDFVQAFVSNLSADMLGAKIQTSDFVYLLDPGTAEFDVEVMGLPVANVLLLEGEDIKGDGILDGKLSVVLASAGPSIPLGKLTSRAPGGKLAYQGSLPDATPALSLAIAALRNFLYRQMEVDVKLVPTGDLNLLVKLQGYSPDVEKGRPINFNLNVSENLPALMESLQASDNFSKRVQQRLSKPTVN